MHPFYVTEHPGCASCLEPDFSVLQAWPIAAGFAIQRTISVPLHRFDTLIAEKKVPQPDFIMMDVQGFESRVIEGLGTAVAQLVGLQAEAHFKPIYKQEMIVPQFVDYLAERGLTFREIRSNGHFESEFVEGDLYFTRCASLTPEQSSLARIWETICILSEPNHHNSK